MENSRKAHILFVEDDDATIHLARVTFQRYTKNDFNVVKTGEGALDYLSNNLQNLPDLIFIDRRLECQIEGDELAEIILTTPAYRKIAIAMMSLAKPSEEDMNYFATIGVKWFADKPLKFENIVKIIETAERKLAFMIVADKHPEVAA